MPDDEDEEDGQVTFLQGRGSGVPQRFAGKEKTSSSKTFNVTGVLMFLLVV